MFERQGPPGLHLLLVEDDRRIRRSLAGILEIDRHVEAVATATNVEEALALVHEAAQGGLQPVPDPLDAVLIDLDRLDDRWPEELPRLRSACTGIAVVALSDDATLRDRALLAGADLSLGVAGVADDIGRVLARISNRHPRGGNS